VRAFVILALVLACAGSALAQAPAGRPERAKTDAADYALPERATLQNLTFLTYRDAAVVGIKPDLLFVSHAGHAAQTIALPRAFHPVAQAIGGDGALWFADDDRSAGRVDPSGHFFPVALASPALAIAGDGTHTDVLEANVVESFDALGVVHRIPLGRTIAHGSIAALPNEIVVAADGIAGIIRIDRNDRTEILKLEDDLRPASLHVVGNTVWFPLFSSGKTATRRIGRVHDRIIQTIDLPTFGPVRGMGAGADNRFFVIESFDVYGVVGLDGQLACERSIGAGFPGSAIAQMFVDGMGSTYLTTSRVPGFFKVTDACR
jgi:hypothetical protein